MNSLQRLCEQVPEWVSIESSSSKKVELKGLAPKPSGASGGEYNLVIELKKNNRIVVYENNKYAKLPSCCLERHINHDGTFCLHYDSSQPLQTAEQAQAWWSSLGHYLDHQDYAQKYRRWPVRAQLSHGEAANTQLKMEAIASSVGWESEVHHAIFRRVGWLAGDLPKISKDKARIVNARTPCPRGCLMLHHPHKSNICVTTECSKACGKTHPQILRVDCQFRKSIEELVFLEHIRRQEEEDVVQSLRKKGLKCCGTMDGCTLNDSEVTEHKAISR